MNRKFRNLIVILVMTQALLTVGVFALPRAVRALPGAYYVRLQTHPLTAGVMELIVTPIPTALPAPALARRAAVQTLPDIPGLPAAATATPSPAPTAPAAATEAAPANTPIPTSPPSPTPSPTPRPTLAPPPPAASIDGLITVKQGFNNCGPANLTIVLNHFGDETTQETAAAYLKPNREDRNVSPWQIGDYVNAFTALRSTVHSGGDLAMVKQFIAAGLPVVIEKGYEPSNAEGWYGHYLTVYGYDDASQQIYSRDTNLGPFDGRPRIDDYDSFQFWWQQFNYTFYVVYEPSQEALVQAILPVQLQQEDTMWAYTAEVARQEIRADPENVFAWFNLGVSQTRLGELTGSPDLYQAGAEAFDEARNIGLPPRTLYYEHRPLMAYWKTGRLDDVIELTDTMLATTGGPWVEELHWYRGHALAGQGNLSAAREAYQEALKVNPNFYPAQQSLDWVNSVLNG